MTFATWPLWGVFLSGISSPRSAGQPPLSTQRAPRGPEGRPRTHPTPLRRLPPQPRGPWSTPHGSGVARGLYACPSRTQHDAFGLHRGASLSARRPEPLCGRTALCSAVRCAHGRARALGSPQLLWVRTREGDCASEANSVSSLKHVPAPFFTPARNAQDHLILCFPMAIFSLLLFACDTF